MRLVKVSVPQGAGSEIAEIAFAQGIGEVSWTLEKVWTCEGEEQTREVPLQDLRCELWQFSHVTPGFVGRVLCASLLLAHGILEDHLLNILGGLLFMPAPPPPMGSAWLSRPS